MNTQQPNKLTDDSVELLAVIKNEGIDLGVRSFLNDALALNMPSASCKRPGS